MSPEPEPHECLEHLEYKEHSWVEQHGFTEGPFERGLDIWWECAICGEAFTARELDELCGDTASGGTS